MCFKKINSLKVTWIQRNMTTLISSLHHFDPKLCAKVVFVLFCEMYRYATLSGLMMDIYYNYFDASATLKCLSLHTIFVLKQAGAGAIMFLKIFVFYLTF